MPDINSEKIINGINGSVYEIIKLGYEAEPCWINITVNFFLLNKKMHFPFLILSSSLKRIVLNNIKPVLLSKKPVLSDKSETNY